MKLTDEQNEGVAWIYTGFQKHKGVILADRMGFGKTAQAIEIIKGALPTNPVLIICPSYVVLNWYDELKKWGVKTPPCVIDSSKQILHTADIYITSYDMATKYEHIFKQLFKKDFSLIVCDESHYLKSWNSLRSRRILGTYKAKKTNLLNKTENVLCLTGTPILNRIEELYNVLIRIAPKSLRYCKKEQFITHYAANVFYTPWGMKHEGVKHEKELKGLLTEVVLSRKKIKGLKNRIEKPIILDISNNKIKSVLKEELIFLNQYGISEKNITDLQKLTKMEGGKLAELRQQVAILKIPIFMQVFSDILENEERPIVYCYHKKVQQALYEEIQTKFSKLKVAVINGTVSMKKRHEILEKYDSGKLDLIIATIGALREGVNITKANCVLFIEFDWTPANMEQAVARVWRKGQKDVVTIYYVYFKSGIDKYILSLITKKDQTIKKIIG